MDMTLFSDLNGTRFQYIVERVFVDVDCSTDDLEGCRCIEHCSASAVPSCSCLAHYEFVQQLHRRFITTSFGMIDDVFGYWCGNQVPVRSGRTIEETFDFDLIRRGTIRHPNHGMHK
jgi:hypothetical protein